MKKNAGFTLVEVVVTIVVSSIALAMIGAMLTYFYRGWNNYQYNLQKSNDENVIISCFDKTSKYFNESGSVATFDLDNQVIYNSSHEVILQIVSNREIIFNQSTFNLKKIKQINIELLTNNVINVKITFNDDSTSSSNFTFIKQIEQVI